MRDECCVWNSIFTFHHFYRYMKDGLHAQNKMNSLARSNASLYGGQVPQGQVPNGAKDDLYDRLRRHAYQGKKSGNRLRKKIYYVYYKTLYRLFNCISV